jgi:hypothetical protein
MWQDALVTVVALAATGVLGRRFFSSRKKPAGSCANCVSGNPCAPAKDEPTVSATVKPVTFYRA